MWQIRARRRDSCWPLWEQPRLKPPDSTGTIISFNISYAEFPGTHQLQESPNSGKPKIWSLHHISSSSLTVLPAEFQFTNQWSFFPQAILHSNIVKTSTFTREPYLAVKLELILHEKGK